MSMDMCLYDEAFTKDEMLEETCRCLTCGIKECSYCGIMPTMVYPQVDGITPTVVAVKKSFRDTWEQTE